MKKIYKIRIISAIAYTVALAEIVYVAFFYEANGYSGGSAKGGAAAILFVLFIAIGGIAIQVYRETRSMQKVIETLKAFLLAALSLPWLETLSKKWRKLMKQIFGTNKKQLKK